MKTYDEMAASVLERRDRYMAEKRRRNRMIQKGSLGLVCCALAVTLAGAITGADEETPDYIRNTAIHEFRQGEEKVEAADPSAVTAFEVLEKQEKEVQGVFVPILIAYNGDIYRGSSEGINGDDHVEEAGTVMLGENYGYTAYKIAGRENSILIIINGGFALFDKVIDLEEEAGGYEINASYMASMGTEFECGELISEKNGVRVYKAIRLQGEGKGDEYIIDISDTLKNKLPELFGDDQNWKEFRWVALPAEKDMPADAAGNYYEAVDRDDLTDGIKAFFGGLYIDESGRFTVVLTEDTPANRADICRELGVREENTAFVKGKYTLSYLTELQNRISQGMIDKTLPFVTVSCLDERANRIIVSLISDSEENVKKLLELDIIGGAIETGVSAGASKEELLIIKE